MSIPAPIVPASALRPHEHLVVRVGAERFALPLAAVAEALDAPRVRAVAGVDAGCVGFVAWRGRQLAVRDAGAAFGVAVARPPAAAIVLAGPGCAVAVDEVLDAVALPPERVQPVRGLRDPLRAVAGVACDDLGLVAVLHPAAVRQAAEAVA
jgi:chemotaxis signal transduction protein